MEGKRKTLTQNGLKGPSKLTIESDGYKVVFLKP
jgi:hypothetical protein